MFIFVVYVYFTFKNKHLFKKVNLGNLWVDPDPGSGSWIRILDPDPGSGSWIPDLDPGSGSWIWILLSSTTVLMSSTTELLNSTAPPGGCPRGVPASLLSALAGCWGVVGGGFATG